VASAALALVVGVAFWPVLGHDFVAVDDERYVTTNPHVRQGLSLAGLGWAWTAFDAANWHPLTWLSHQLDWQLFGADPTGHHLTSLLLHVANTIALFLLLERMTSSAVRSALVAVLFGLHPQHVESVAWVAERKDVLATFFWMLAIGAWIRWVRCPGALRYSWVVLAMAAGLCAKPMLVTLPFTLLLLDCWPLRRFDLGSVPAGQLGRLLREKIPLFVLAAASCAVTLLAQRSGGAVASLELYPLAVRAANAIVAYATYLSRTVWPVGLAMPYPHPGADVPLPKLVVSAALLAGLSLLCFATRRRHPHLAIGWMWFLGTLVPVIGLVQVGSQALADRYTYVPLLGLFLALAWSIPASGGPLGRRSREDAPAVRRDTLPLALTCALVPLLSVLTWLQLEHWRDESALARRALAVTRDNALAHDRLGLELARSGEPEQAIPHHLRAIEIRPRFAEAHHNLAGALVALGRVGEALERYREALRLEPDYPEARLNWGVALVRSGRMAEAIEQFDEAVRLRPAYGKAHANLAAAHLAAGHVERARQEIELARRGGFEPPDALVRAVERLGPPD